jgi:hypothetical protein
MGRLIMPAWQPIPGETPIDPSGLKILGVTNRRELNIVEAENIRKAVVKYLAASPSERTAPFDFGWCVRLQSQRMNLSSGSFVQRV